MIDSKATLIKIKLLILDVDGVLTDGGIYVCANGDEMIRFNAQDGMGIKMLQTKGIVVAVISGRHPPAVVHRLRKLGIEHVFLGHENKIVIFDDLIKILALTPDQVAYVGDDWFDVPVMEKVGLPIAVANALPVVKTAAKYCTRQYGGHGAVREVCDLICSVHSS